MDVQKAEKIKILVDKAESEILDFALRLVKQPSETPPGDERGVADLIVKQASQWGLPEPETWAEEPNRPNLIFTLKGARSRRSLILNGHMDTKPVGDASQWSVDPGKPRILNGKLYGRGSADMKGGVAGILASAMALSRSGIALQGDLKLALTADEEGGSAHGARFLAEKGLCSDAMLIAEPSGMERSFDSLGIACRGAALGKVVAYGTQMHSSISDRGGCINASVKMAEVLVEFAKNLKTHLRYDPHDLYPGGPTVNPGVILEGGIYYGVIPGRASFGFDLRVIPGMSYENVKIDIENFLETLRTKDGELRIELAMEKPPMDWFPPVEIERTHSLVTSCLAASRAILGTEPRLIGVPFSTDGTHFVKKGTKMGIIPSFGPGLIKLAHGPDEHVEVKSIIDSAKIFALSTLTYLSGQ